SDVITRDPYIAARYDKPETPLSGVRSAVEALAPCHSEPQRRRGIWAVAATRIPRALWRSE
ncbi:MAG TPA: hypothetical protein VGK04_10295, partial [Thermoanaerobaculia bacterium]